ncbi:MAG TPA: helix-turn-helix domain-containing protein [Cytophagales bacterium]|nr:helix-turn-helix domain-containing protein [Cytophagales bacterium]
MEEEIISKLKSIEDLLNSQSLLLKEVLTLAEAAKYLNLSTSHVYKLTSKKEIPHYCPNGKKIYFNRSELNKWLQSNKQLTIEEIEQKSIDYVTKTKVKTKLKKYEE